MPSLPLRPLRGVLFYLRYVPFSFKGWGRGVTFCLNSLTTFEQGGRGHWAVYDSSPQSFMIIFLGTIIEFDWLVYEANVSKRFNH